MAKPLTAREEWAAMWPLPLVALTGISGSALFHFSSGALIAAITSDLHWTRVQFLSGFTLQLLLSLVLAPVIGRLVLRYGPRRLLVAGIPPFAACFAALGVADGDLSQWRLLCAAYAVAGALVSPVAWITAVAARFDRSRGFATATALAGLGVGASAWPIAAAFLLDHLGWRMTFGALALSWMAIAWPLTFFFVADPPRKMREDAGRPAAFGFGGLLLSSRTFVCLLVAGSLFASVSLGINLHMIPILQSEGFGLTTAAGIAGLSGILTFAGRIGTGWILDRAPAKPVGMIVFLLPVLAATLLLVDGRSLAAAVCAATLFGLAAGGEIDLMTYVASRNLPQGAFAPAYAMILAIFGAVAGIGPLVAGWSFDRTGSYVMFLTLVIPIDLLGATVLMLMPDVDVP